ncbi:MAG: hypothetical protein JW836_09060 [Deltaproteobacteria bacterium]|nr:hypothetical protein [Deltaproteobacteria bacterium]
MSEEHKSPRKYVYVKYVGRTAVMTGRVREALDITGTQDIAGVLDRLEAAYPGFMNVYNPPDGMFNQNTAIICRRKGYPSFSIVDPETLIKEGDVLTFW